MAAAQGGCGPAVVLCAPDGGAAAGACASVDLSRSHPVGDGGAGESFRLGADGEIAGAWRMPGEPGGPPLPTWTPDAGAGAPDADWRPDAGIPTCPAGWTRTADGLCDPALRTCPTGAESLPGGQCTTTGEADCPSDPYADPGPEAMGAAVAYVLAAAPASCADRGSRACPWHTLAEALASGRPWVLVGEGTYGERLDITSTRHVIGRCAARVRIEGVGTDPTVFAHGDGVSLDLRGVTMTGAGIGIEVESGAAVHGRSLAVLRAVREGVRVQGASSFEATDIVIADTQPQGGDFGHGANIGDMGSLRLVRAALLRNLSSGASSFGGALTVRDSVVSATRVPPRGALAAGLFVKDRAEAHVERVWIADNEDTGITIVGEGTVVTVVDVTVRGTLPFARPSIVSPAVYVQSGARLAATRLAVDENLGHGVYVERGADPRGLPAPIAYAEIHDSVIRGPRSVPADSRQVGLFAQLGSDVRAFGLRVIGATHVGVLATGDDTVVVLEDSVVEGTRRNVSATTTSLGCGVKVENGGRLTGRRVLVADSAWAGFFVDEPSPTSDRTMPDLVLEGSVVRGNRYDQMRRSGGGIVVQRGADARLTRVRVTGNEGVGVVALRATATVNDSVLEDAVPLPFVVDSGRTVMESQNLIAQDHATVTANGVWLRGGRGALGVLATGEGASLAIFDSLFEGPNPDVTTATVACMIAELAGHVAAERVVLRRCLGIAAYTQTDGASLALTDALVQGTRSVVDEHGEATLGRALSAIDGTAMNLTRVLVEDNAEIGVFAASAETSVTLSGVVIRRVRALPDMRYGQGMFAQEGAHVEANRLVIAESTTSGLFATTGALVELSDSLVTDTRLSPRGEQGDGMDAVSGGTLRAERVAVRRVFNAGVTAVGDGSRALLRDVAIVDVRADPGQIARGVRSAGRGLLALSGGQIEGNLLALVDVTGFGVTAASARAFHSETLSRASLADVFIRDVRLTPTGPQPQVARSYSEALRVQDGTTIEVSRAAIELGAWAFVVENGAIIARHVVVTRQSQGLGRSPAERDATHFTSEDVNSRDNLTNEFVYNQSEEELSFSADSVACTTLSDCRLMHAGTDPQAQTMVGMNTPDTQYPPRAP